jgi:hypothetical protein
VLPAGRAFFFALFIRCILLALSSSLKVYPRGCGRSRQFYIPESLPGASSGKAWGGKHPEAALPTVLPALESKKFLWLLIKQPEDAAKRLLLASCFVFKSA